MEVHRPDQKTVDMDLPKQKEHRCEHITAEVAKITDKLGKPIDAGIIATVVALNALSINTAQSCEEHLDHGTDAPYIDIERQGLDAINIQVRQTLKRTELAKDEEEEDRTGLLASQATVDRTY